MNVLFLTLVKIKEFEQPNIYLDLLREFSKRNHKVYICTPIENKDNIPTRLRNKNNTTLLQVKIGNYFNTQKIEKGITLLTLEKNYLSAIKNYFDNIKFDMVLYSTPPITFSKVINYIKKRDDALSYLLLKDIFPQNAVDMDMMSKDSIIYKYFRRKERQLYKISDYIGCMSEGNKSYLLKHNNIEHYKVEICPNCISTKDLPFNNTINLRKEIGIPENEVVFLYGGNLGEAQGIDFILKCLTRNEQKPSGFIVIVGQGTKYYILNNWYKKNKPKHSILLEYLPTEQYNNLVMVCDVGLIFLDHRFTIPNFPSRILSYMIAKLPILAATDPNTDLGTVIENAGFGYWCASNDEQKFIDTMKLFYDRTNRVKMGIKGFEYLKKNYSSEVAYKTIINHYKHNA